MKIETRLKLLTIGGLVVGATTLGACVSEGGGVNPGSNSGDRRVITTTATVGPTSGPNVIRVAVPSDWVPGTPIPDLSEENYKRLVDNIKNKVPTPVPTFWPTLGPTCRLPDGQQVSGNYSDGSGFCEKGVWVIRRTKP